MLVQKDLQAIEILLDRKLDEKLDEKLDQKFKENNKILKDEIIVETKSLISGNNKFLKDEIIVETKSLISEKFDDMFGYVNDGFTNVQVQLDDLKDELKKRPTREEVYGEMNSRFDDVLSIVNEGFTGMQLQFDRLDNELAKRPTKEEIFSWADRRFVDLEIAKDRHDYLHIEELDKLPTPLEISKALVKKGFKKLN